MPLDLKKVITQLSNLEDKSSRDLNNHRLDSTYKLFQTACESHEKLIGRLLETSGTGNANFFFATPYSTGTEKASIDKIIEPDKNFSLPHITLATDGSQINPSAHEFTSAFLINTGLVAIPYFDSSIPVQLSSEPTLYKSLEDIDPTLQGETFHEEDLVSYERTLNEIEELVKLAKKYTQYKMPIVCLLDGTIIHWHLQKFNDLYIAKFVERFSNAVLELKSLGIPMASFLSNSRSNDLINMLRIFKCPYEEVNCKKYCSNIESRNLPCNPTTNYKPVMDRKLIEKYLIEKNAILGTRSVLFKSNSKILDYYTEDLKVFFFYINTGTEIARVELPSYVAKDNKLLNLLHNIVALQCKVGFGYPVTLSEAHLLAVVNKNDRQIFYDLIKEQFLKNRRGLIHQTSIRLSNKELKKRISFV